jgi:Flp pilus assembly CpaE family ATPase
MVTLGADESLVDKVRVVINRVGCDFYEGAIDLKKAEETIGKPAYWQIPDDAKTMMSSRNAGVPLVQFAPRSKVYQHIVGLANALCGKNGNGEAPKKRGLFSFR